MSPLHPRRSAVAAVLALAVGTLVVPDPAVALPAVPSVSSAPAASSTPVRVIIEVDGPTAPGVVGVATVARAQQRGAGVSFRRQYAAAVTRVERQQDAVLDRARSAGVRVTDSAPVTGVLNAVVATVDPTDLATLRRTTGVARVTEATEAVALDVDSVPSTGAPQVWEQTTPSGTHLEGDGVTVAVVDTGIDYSLEDLGGGFGEEFRVVGGYDFVNDDADPTDDNGHGTHVAGIVGGAGTRNVEGMAPDVSLTAWKVLGENGSGDTAGVLLGLEAAVDPAGAHPADVVNLSLGAPGDGTDPIGRAATAAVRQGVVVVAAAGNAGPAEQTIGSPASAPGVLAVGAGVTGVDLPTMTLTTPEGSRPLTVARFPLSANPPAAGLTADLVEVGDGFEQAYEDAGDVTGKIVVIQSLVVGSLEQVQGGHLLQAQLAEEHGAAGVLLYAPSPTDPADDGGSDTPVRTTADDGTAPFSTEATPADVHVLDDGGFDLRRESLVMLSTTSALYQTFRQQVRDGTARATIGSVDATDRLADFSSRGPSDGMTLKPEIVAPGFEILSTLPSVFGVEGDRYRMSGTSMASPHVAGAAALLVQARPDLTAARLRATLIGSARELDSVDADASPSGQGAGTLDVAAAVDQHVTAAPDAVSLGLVDMAGTGARSEPVVLTNDGPAAVTVALTVHPSGVSTGTATLSTRRVTVPAGGEATVSLSVRPRLGHVDTETSGVLVGAVSDGSTLRVPYAAYVRTLAVQATPDPARGSSQVFVHSGSGLLPETGVTVTATAPSGRRTTVGVSEDARNDGWYRGRVPLTETGSYTIRARAVVAGRTITGISTIRSVSADQPGRWEQVGLTGEAARLAVSPGATGTALGVTTDSAYPMVTTDRGATWTRVRSMPVAGGWGLPAADPRAAGAFYLGLNGRFGAGVLDASYEGRVLHTPDAGRTWTVLPFRDTAVLALLASGSSLVAVVADGAEISADGGRTWRHVQHVWQSEVVDAELAGDDLVVSDLFSVSRLADVTGTGEAIEQTYVPDGGLVYNLGADGEAAVAVLSDTSMVRSTDGGTTWAPIGESGQSYVTDVQVVDGTLYLSGLSSYTTSEDYGTTLVEHDFPADGPLVTDVDRWPGSGPETALLSMENAGLYETEGDGWDKIGLSATTVSSVDVGTDTGGSPVLRVTDQEGLHERALADLDADEQDWGSTGHEGYIGVELSDVVQSPRGARSVWSIGRTATGQGKIMVGAPGEEQQRVGPRGSYGATALAVSPLDEDTVAVGYSSLIGTGWMVSTDGFETWTSYDTGQHVNQLRFDPVRPGRLWLATEDGVLRSDDLGATTTRVTTTPALSVHLERATRDRVVVGERGAIRWSTDAGRTVHRAVLADTSAAIGSFTRVVVPAGRFKGVELLVAGAEQWHPHGLTVNGGGALVSTDGGRSWVAASAGLTALSVRSLDVSPDGAWVYAGTDDGGVHRTASSSLVPRSAVRRTTAKVSAPSTARLGTRPLVSISVRSGSVPATGTVLVSVQRAGGAVVLRTRLTLRAGRASFRPPALRKAGQYVVRVAYEPTGLFAASRGNDTVRVR
ncbi:S8 family serine peptidase [Nocardioides plantarum]|uniref:S8 family serine peptidase n=1 Tax=Nocardioides plantarum TaxID=29299 RepID=A0ABV5KEA5_9ACTN|nr:S8 family serine peptidase [Nocardioides plantarum]